jgi:hypothetical protein
MKKFLIFAVFFLVCGAVVFSHEKGDLALNFELFGGGGFSDIKIEGVSTISGITELGLNHDVGMRVTTNYYFFNWLSVNTGIGFGHMGSSYKLVESSSMTSLTDYSMESSAFYFGIPLGLKLNLRAFVIGGGLVYYMPFNASSELVYTDPSNLIPETSSTDNSFDYDSFLGWYFDIGFDLGGRSGKTSGIGMLFRIAINRDDVGSSSIVPYTSFKQGITFLYVLNYSFAVASYPMGGK